MIAVVEGVVLQLSVLRSQAKSNGYGDMFIVVLHVHRMMAVISVSVLFSLDYVNRSWPYSSKVLQIVFKDRPEY